MKNKQLKKELQNIARGAYEAQGHLDGTDTEKYEALETILYSALDMAGADDLQAFLKEVI